MRIYTNKLSRENSSRVNVCCVWLKTFIIAHDLGCWSSRHWSYQ
jgi:hypothetical protein